MWSWFRLSIERPIMEEYYKGIYIVHLYTCFAQIAQLYKPYNGTTVEYADTVMRCKGASRQGPISFSLAAASDEA